MKFVFSLPPRLLAKAALCGLTALAASTATTCRAQDPIAKLQACATKTNVPSFGHWGPNPDKYSSWTTHSNRLIPIYTFGQSLSPVTGPNSVYRSTEAIEKLYGQLPAATHNPDAQYADQTDVFRLQQIAAQQGKKRIILMVFDGMDYVTTRAAAISKTQEIQYTQGRGRGLAFQDYRGVETDFGYFVTSPHNNGTTSNVNTQIVKTPGGKTAGGYDPSRAGHTPWAHPANILYPIANDDAPQAYTDSAASATSMTSGIKTYNAAINVNFIGREVQPIARTLQAEGFAVGVVTSVPISHATPAAAYANNVDRDDYQDLTRDLLGLPSIIHPGGLAGVDVLLGAGYGINNKVDGAQGKNFVPGNRYLTAADQTAVDTDAQSGGKYVIAQRTSGKSGSDVLDKAARRAQADKKRLFGFFGTKHSHLPFQTADGEFDPVKDQNDDAESYTKADIHENPTLSQLATAALDVLDSRSKTWWLMIEAGDVDWANHANNIDNSIGAVHSGDAAFKTTVDWIEAHGGWDDTVLILTADHGHYFFLDNPQALITPAETEPTQEP